MQQPGPPPRYSDDGRWWWDGQRWVPTAPTGPPAAASGSYVQHAGFWLRFLAYWIDWAILLVGDVVVFFVFGLTGGILDGTLGSSNTGSSSVGVAGSVASLLAWITVLAGNWLYYSLLESSAQQATIGKRAIGIKVTDLDGRRLSFGRATARYFSKLLSGLICDIGYVMAGFTERKQALHDMVASTLVVRSHPTNAQQLQPGSSGSGATVAILSVLGGAGILVFTSIIVIVILLTMGGQIKNVFSNVVVALNS
ncbi:MAG TPA: RDD family protein [Candidatus Dormibacteraeota bacterium]